MSISEHISVSSRIQLRAINDDGTSNSNLSSAAIIIIVLAVASFAVLVGYSTTRFFYDWANSEDQTAVQDLQQYYMREVRQRNLESMRFDLNTKRSFLGYNREDSSNEANERRCHTTFT